MRRIVTCAVLPALLAFPALAQENSVRSHPRVREALNLLEVWADAQRAYQEVPGMSMAVVYDQETVWSKAFGYAHPDREIFTTPETLYSICSISKLFTSIGVMQLRDAGRLRLDDPVSEHLDWLTIEDTYPDAPPVTIEGILTHSSGLPRESDYPYWTGPEFPFPTHEEIVGRIAEQRELYPAATYFQYSNLGLTLAGEVVAAVSGEDYDAYIRRHILAPLGMENTYPAIPVELKGKRMATGYSALTRSGSREPVPLFVPRGIAPAMGFASTAEDLARFASWQFRVLHHGADEVLARNTLREMQRVHWVDPNWERTRGLGFSVRPRNKKTFVGHGGSCPGFRSQLLIQSDERIATVFMANANGVNTGAFVNRAYDIVAPAIDAATAEKAPDTPLTKASFAKYTGAYSAWPWGGETAVIPWEGKLAMLPLPTDDPLEALVMLEHVEEHTFRRVRDDEALGEEIVFEVDEEGQVTRMWRHSNYEKKIR